MYRVCVCVCVCVCDYHRQLARAKVIAVTVRRISRHPSIFVQVCEAKRVFAATKLSGLATEISINVRVAYVFARRFENRAENLTVGTGGGVFSSKNGNVRRVNTPAQRITFIVSRKAYAEYARGFVICRKFLYFVRGNDQFHSALAESPRRLSRRKSAKA